MIEDITNFSEPAVCIKDADGKMLVTNGYGSISDYNYPVTLGPKVIGWVCGGKPSKNFSMSSWM